MIKLNIRRFVSALFCILTLSLSSAPSPALANGDIIIGVIAGLTRHGSTYGLGITQGAEMAVREINEAGGIKGHKLKLKIVDDTSDPARSAIAMRRLISTNVDIIVGGWGSSQVLSNMNISEQAGVPYIVVGGTNPRITSSDNKWTFRVIQTDGVMGAQLAGIAINTLGLNRIAVISDSNAYGTGNRDVFLKALTTLGHEPVEVQTYRTADTDFRQQLEKISSEKPDGLVIFGTIPAAPAIMIQARELGIEAKFLGTGGLANNALMSLAPKASEGTVLMSFFDENSDPEAKAWAELYRKAYSNDGTIARPTLAVWEYRAIKYIVAPCIETAINDKQRLRDCISNWSGQLFGLKGVLHFDETGQLVQPPVIVEVQDGAFKPFGK